MLLNDLQGKYAIVTGGGTGIGKEITRQLGEMKCNVIIASRNSAHLLETEREFKDQGFSVDSYKLNVTQPEEVEKFANFVQENYPRLDILINNAGGNFICSTRKLSVNGWLSVINITLNGTFYCSKFLGEVMINKGNGGSIINMVATYGWTGGPGNVHSAAGKAGIIALTRSLAVEWAQYGIRVNAVAPGAIDTSKASEQLKFLDPSIKNQLVQDIPIGRLGTSEEIGKSVVFLCSPYWSSYVNGEVLVVDGGHVNYKGLDRNSYLTQGF